MKAVVFDAHGGLDMLAWRDWPDPSPGADEVVVKVEAAALNGFDPMVLEGIATLKTPMPMIPGGDIAGVVVETGRDVPAGAWPRGKHVLVNPLQPGRGMMGETIRGGFCEYIAVPHRYLIEIPDGVSFVDAAALPVAYGTAYRMMRRACLARGDRMLILGASGGVGVCCLQLGKLAGAEIAVCSSSAKKNARLIALGADHAIDTSKEDFVQAAVRLWGKPKVYGESGGADLVINYIGGPTWAKALKTVRRGGRLTTCGATAGYDPQTDIRYIWSFELSIIGSNGWDDADLAALLALVASGQLKPAIDGIRPMAQAALSMKALMDREVVGKAVLTP